MLGLGPSKLVVACNSVTGIVFYSEFGGYWSINDQWPSDVSSASSYRISPNIPTWAICVCDNTVIKPTALRGVGTGKIAVVNIRDFLAVVGNVDGTFVQVSTSCTVDVACRALIANYSLIMRYRRAGPYDETFMITVPSNMVANIDKMVTEKMSKYVPEEDLKQLADQLEGLPCYVLDLRTFQSYTRNKTAAVKLVELCVTRGRKMVGDFVLPITKPTDVVIADNLKRDLTFKIVSRLRSGIHRIDLEECLGTDCPFTLDAIIANI
jgi:hypothetical protein